jgi:hypothetical protein
MKARTGGVPMAKRKRPQARDPRTGRFIKARPDLRAILQGWRPYQQRVTLVPATAENVLEIPKVQLLYNDQMW